MASGPVKTKASGIVIAALVAGLSLGGCATTGPTGTADDVNDPLEVPNRLVFAVNDALDTLVLQPVAHVYREAVPDPIQMSVRAFLNYLRTPVILANDLLQGEWGRARITLERFIQNSMVVGLWDLAAENGQPFHDEDFGQTLGVWGMGEMFYLVLPVFGPSSPRDGIGLVVDQYLDPLTRYLSNTHRDGVSLGRAGLDGVDTRSRYLKSLDEIEKTSLDYYATIRSLYRQKRADEIANGKGGAIKLVPGLSSDDDAPRTQTSTTPK
jgi:phospholipid-binding lipoprotein MlaA